MRQLLQNLRTGEAQVLDVPAPPPGPNDIIVSNRASLVSAGTERTIHEFSQRGLLGKAQLRPDLVREVFTKAKRDGFVDTFHAIRSRLDQPVALGYSCAGEVISAGTEVTDLRIGARVACAGGGFALHAEAVRIPRILAAQIPEPGEQPGRRAISFSEAAFTTVGTVALHGLRLASPQLGETIAVIGLGVVGLLSVQLARAAGCRVIATDLDLSRCQLARKLGCDQVASAPTEFECAAMDFTRGRGTDSVLVAAATESSQPLELAARVARDRACVVCIGATGTNLPRKLFYQKELDFRVSRSYGPGRYDSRYEERGCDYPDGYVRWTEGRNLEAFLEMLSRGKVLVEPLISHRFPISDAQQAYTLLSRKHGESSLGIVIEYPGENELPSWIQLQGTETLQHSPVPTVRVGPLGAGNYVRSTFLPAMKTAPGSQLVAVCAASGASAFHVAKKHGFESATTSASEVIHHSQINTVVIATRHHLHATQTVAALKAGKHVFCEKPLCINEDELHDVINAYQDARKNFGTILMVGFNRRFAPLAVKLKEFLPTQQPLVMNYRVNAGSIPTTHWIQDPDQGVGRVIGEVCHFVDLMTFLSGSQPARVFAACTPNSGRTLADNASLQVTFHNGSIGVISYISNGDKVFSKERLEIFAGGKVAVLDDFWSLELSSEGRRRKVRSLFRADKGHRAEWRAMCDAILSGRESPIPFSEIVATTRATFRMMDSLRSGEPETVESIPIL